LVVLVVLVVVEVDDVSGTATTSTFVINEDGLSSGSFPSSTFFFSIIVFVVVAVVAVAVAVAVPFNCKPPNISLVLIDCTMLSV